MDGHDPTRADNRPGSGPDPHAGQPVLRRGPDPERAAGALLLLHGRGATAAGMLPLSDALGVDRLTVLAPQAAGGSWYPQSFLAPIATNQPYLDSAVRRVAALVAELAGRGVPPERVAILGFSQGACLAAELVARHPRRYGALLALTGGLVGPAGGVRPPEGRLDGTPVFLGAGDPDPHVPFERVRQTAALLGEAGAVVDLRRYPGRGHTVGADELEACRALLRSMVAAAGAPAREEGRTS